MTTPAKPSLADVAGKFIHLSQFSGTLTGYTWDSLDEADLTPGPAFPNGYRPRPVLELRDYAAPSWGHLSYRIEPDGSLVCAGMNVDSSG